MVNHGTIRTFAGAHYVSGVVNAVVLNHTNGVIETSTLVNSLMLEQIPTNRGRIVVGNSTAAIRVNNGNVVNEGTIQGVVAGGFFSILNGSLINNSNVFINGAGHVFSALSTLNNGRIIVTNSQQSGQLATFGGPVTNNGLIQIHSTLSPNAFDGQRAIGASNFVNNGTILTVGRYGTLLNNAIPSTLINSPVTNQAGGSIISSNGAALTFTGTLVNQSGATLQVQSNSLLAIGATRSRQGHIVAGTASYRNDGIIDLDGGAFGTSVLTNSAGATLQGYGDLGQVSLTNLAAGNFAQVVETRNIVNSGLIAPDGVLNVGAISNLAGGEIIGVGTIQSVNYTNSQLGGFSGVNTGARILNNAGATVLASGGTLVISNGFVNNTQAGTIGATNGGRLVIDGGTQVLTNNGMIALTGGELVNGSIVGPGNITMSTGTNALTIAGSITVANGSSLSASNTVATVSGIVTNHGVIRTANAQITFSNGVFVSVLGTVDGSPGDIFEFKNDFLIQSANAATFDLASSTVSFSGDVGHTNAVTGLDLGATTEAPFVAGNFAYGEVQIVSTSDHIYFTNQVGAIATTALYAYEVDLLGDTNNVANLHSPFNIYYAYSGLEPNNAYLNDQTYALDGGGFLIPAIPEPSTLLLAFAASALLLRRIRPR